MKKHYILLIILLFSIPGLSQQTPRTITLDQAIDIALDQSPTALSARHRFRASYWQYRTFVAEYRPKLNLDATLPSLNRSIQSIQQDDGSFVFQSSESANSSLDLSLRQKIGFTGGEIFLSSGLERLDLFLNDSTVTSYLSSPINIGFSQPLFGFNSYQWDKDIVPLEYKEAKHEYIETLERVRLETANYFFAVLQAQMTHQINLMNQANNDTLYKIARGRYNIGTIAENELLQLELRLLQSNADVESSALDLENKLFELKSYLRLPEEDSLNLEVPVPETGMVATADKAIAMARENRSDALAFDRRELEARMEVNRAKRESRFSMNLYAQYGLTQSAAVLSEAFDDPSESQQLTVGISVPIIDWGLAKGKIRMAESNRELVLSNVEQERIDFLQQVRYQVDQFNMQANQLRIAAKSDTVAQKRYNVTKQRYLIGKISVTELNIAQEERDNSRLGYIRALQNYWRNYYRLRQETLYDFEQDREIQVDPEELLEN
jgi:outer membrane protein TolC